MLAGPPTCWRGRAELWKSTGTQLEFRSLEAHVCLRGKQASQRFSSASPRDGAAGWVGGARQTDALWWHYCAETTGPQAGGGLKLLNPRGVHDHPAGACGTGPALTLHEAPPEARAFPVTVGTKLCSSSRMALQLAASLQAVKVLCQLH